MSRKPPTHQERWLASQSVPAPLIVGLLFAVIMIGLGLLGEALNMERLTAGTLSSFLISLLFGPICVLYVRLMALTEIPQGRSLKFRS
jgi:hypothetical protein